MNQVVHYIIAFCISIVVSIIFMPIIRKLAIKIGAIDEPNYRKVHQITMPRLGGLAIVLGTYAGLLFLQPRYGHIMSIIIGSLIILGIGVLDDKFVLKAWAKFFGQLAAAFIPVCSGLKIDFVTLPFGGELHLGWFGYIITILWIIGITNAINLMDGLDGLAGGISVICLSTILITAVIDQQFLVIAMTIVLIGSTIGFLIFNFHPAKIFMGDTGALFLGYMLSIISVIGFFKSVATFSVMVPILILAVPIFDTLFAIIRRLINGQKIYSPDKYHLHHCLLAIGFSHRTTVLIIYSIATLFGIAAVVFSNSTLWSSLVIFMSLLLIMQTNAEVVGLINGKYRFVMNSMKKLALALETFKK